MKLSEQAKTARDEFFINLVNEMCNGTIFLFLPLILLFIGSDMSIISFIIRIAIFLLLYFHFQYELLGTIVSGTIIFIPLISSFYGLLVYPWLLLDYEKLLIVCVIFLFTIIGIISDIRSNSYFIGSKAILAYQIIFLALLLRVAISNMFLICKYFLLNISSILLNINISSKFSIVSIIITIVGIIISRYLIKLSKIIRKSETSLISKFLVFILPWISILSFIICFLGWLLH